MPIAPANLRIHSRRVVLPDGMAQATISARDGIIVAVDRGSALPDGAVDVGDHVILPGLVDSHVHVNDPGRSDWEGFWSATRAAAAGGVTTIVDMPLNSVPPTTTPEGLAAKREVASGRCWVDVGLWGGVVPGNEAWLRALHESGVRGFKSFLVPSGVDEFPHVGEPDLRRALPVLAELGAVLLVHAELPGPIAAAERELGTLDPCRYLNYLRSRPPQAEIEAIEMMVRLCRETGARVHIVHLAAGDAIETLEAARSEGLPITSETCPHYLNFEAESIPDRATQFKCAPPIRERRHREALWDGLADGVIDIVTTDHSPCTPGLKLLDVGDFMDAWGGIASLQLGLRSTWTEARARRIPLEQLAEWMAAAPARLAGLEGRKGRIAVGHDADLVVFDPDLELEVHGHELEHRHPVTPYDGRTLHGRIQTTYLRGRAVYDRGSFAPEPHGVLVGGGA